MTTQLISLNNYRKNISTLWKKWKEENIKYIVMVHSQPVFEVIPIMDNSFEDNLLELVQVSEDNLPKNVLEKLDTMEDKKFIEYK